MKIFSLDETNEEGRLLFTLSLFSLVVSHIHGSSSVGQDTSGIRLGMIRFSLPDVH